MDWYKDYGGIDSSSEILHVGSGAEGEINFLESGHRYAIDPLADFYKHHFGAIINQDVEFLEGRGELLPFDDNSLDLVLTCNSVDHAEEPGKVISEISRVLKKGGILYLAVHVRTECGHLKFEIKKRLRPPPDHYNCFTKRLLKKALRRHSLSVLSERGETKSEDSEQGFLYFRKNFWGSRRTMFHVLAERV